MIYAGQHYIDFVTGIVLKPSAYGIHRCVGCFVLGKAELSNGQDRESDAANLVRSCQLQTIPIANRQKTFIIPGIHGANGVDYIRCFQPVAAGEPDLASLAAAQSAAFFQKFRSGFRFPPDALPAGDSG